MTSFQNARRRRKIFNFNIKKDQNQSKMDPFRPHLAIFQGHGMRDLGMGCERVLKIGSWDAWDAKDAPNAGYARLSQNLEIYWQNLTNFSRFLPESGTFEACSKV